MIIKIMMIINLMFRDKHIKERLSLETSRDSIADELLSTQKQLECELKWKETAESTHKQLLIDKRELTLKVTELEDSLREKNHQIVELECKMNRTLQENKLLEERNRKSLVERRGTVSNPPALQVFI